VRRRHPGQDIIAVDNVKERHIISRDWSVVEVEVSDIIPWRASLVVGRKPEKIKCADV
jgi:hypothetical protein